MAEPNRDAAPKKEAAPLALKEAGFAFVPQTYQELMGFAKEICQTDFVPKAFFGKPAAVLAAWQTGKEVGLPPMASLQSIGIINGRPSIHSNGYWALITSHPLCEWFTELPPHEALKLGYGECTIKRRGNPHPIVRRFTMEEAKTAQLLGKDNWKNYPGDMLQNRARHRAGDDAIPEAAQGLLPSQVALDIPPEEYTVTEDRPAAIARPQRASEAVQTEQVGGDPGLTGNPDPRAKAETINESDFPADEAIDVTAEVAKEAEEQQPAKQEKPVVQQAEAQLNLKNRGKL